MMTIIVLMALITYLWGLIALRFEIFLRHAGRQPFSQPVYNENVTHPLAVWSLTEIDLARIVFAFESTLFLHF